MLSDEEGEKVFLGVAKNIERIANALEKIAGLFGEVSNPDRGYVRVYRATPNED